MKKIFFLIILISFSIININYSNANFSDFTKITNNKTFEKPHGENRVLKVYEEFYINPFIDSTIRKQTNSTTRRGITTVNNIYFIVDGITFNSSHSLYKGAGSFYHETNKNFVSSMNSAKITTNYTNHSITTYMEILENTYNTSDSQANTYNNKTPKQSILVRKYYEVTFHHDLSKPTCGSLKLFNNEDLTGLFEYNIGEWLNENKYYTIVCADPQSGCKCEYGDTSCEKIGSAVRTSAKVLGHLSVPDAKFTNNVNLVNNSCSVSGAPMILYDKRVPKIDFYKGDYNFNINTLSNITHETFGGKKYNGEEINGKNYYFYNHTRTFKADDNKEIKINISDLTENGSLYGISGLKEYNINITKIKNKNNNDVNENLTSCNQSWSTETQYNPDGTKTENDEKEIIIDCEASYIAGTYKVNLQAKDQAGNETKVELKYIIYPTDLDTTKSSILVDSTGNKYANNSDYYTYTLTLKDKFENPIYDKSIIEIKQNIEEYSSPKTININMINNSGDIALIEYGYTGATVQTDDYGKINFKLKSLSPGEFTQRFKITMNKWDYKYDDINGVKQNIFLNKIENNSFKKPFIGKLKASKDGGTTWSDLPDIGTDLDYKLEIIQKDNILNSIIPTINNFKDNIKVTDYSNTELQNLSNISSLDSKNPKFSTRINTSEIATSLGTPGIKIINNDNKSPITISYSLGGKNIIYYLGAGDSYNNREIIKLENNSEDNFIGVKVIGTLQGAGKSEFTGQEENFSDLSKSELREKIRSNAYKYISSMTNGQEINGVKYVEGDTEISRDNLSYETLVVKDGNVIISGNLNTSGKKLGIIVLKDNYNVNNDYNNKGNIYIKPNVSQINAILYADGGVISSNSSGTPYITDTSTRTSELQKQLIINGTLFTRNTIGGAILAGGEYILPGGSRTENYNKAMIYDLNYLRRGNNGCDEETDGNCIINDATIIKYDSSIQNNPPKLFGN